MKLWTSAILVSSIMIFAGTIQAGPTWNINEDSSMKLSFLGQAHFLHDEDAEQQDDFYLRRARFILSGQITDGVKFFVETDNDNAGKNDTDVSTDIQDAFVDVRLLDTESGEHWVEAGLILLPFSFENRSSAASLMGIDYNSSVIKLVNTFVWRDNGAMLHGNFGDRFSYCVGTFDGYDKEDDTKNPDADLRFTGHAALNLVGNAETGWFYSQVRLPKENYLSLGAGIDMQDQATLTVHAVDEGEPAIPEEVVDSENYVIDLQSAYVVNERVSLTLNGGYYFWDNTVFKGDTASAETGFLVDHSMAVLKYEYQNPDDGDDTANTTAGLHYFLKGQNARAGIEYRWGDSNDQVLIGLQFLL
jgi:hypothetical protein